MESIDPTLLAPAYCRILEKGMARLRNACHGNQRDYVRIEIDHLHNIPSYMQDDNVFRHAFYYCTERPAYLEQVMALTDLDTSSRDFLLSQYQSSWESLHSALLPFADVINTHHYMERL